MIVQMFNLPFRRVAGKLATLSRLGVSHVLVSPPQKSTPSLSWWARYQPVDFTSIEGPLGNATDLVNLCRKAAEKGIQVMADAVLNHMTNHPWYVRMHRGRVYQTAFPRFGPQDFHTPETASSLGREKLAGNGRRALPELRTDHPYVQNELKNYLHGLIELGIRGFRFDAARHISPSLWPFALDGLEQLIHFGELIYSRSSHYSSAHLDFMKATDFPFARLLKESFSYGGDLRALSNPEGLDRALWGPASVRFVNYHDFARRGGSFRYFKLARADDRALASAYILGNREGIPLVYYNDLRNKTVKNGMLFHHLAGNLPSRTLLASANQLIWTRGNLGLVGINKSREHFFPGGYLRTGLHPGLYSLSGVGIVVINSRGEWKNPLIPAQSAVFLLPGNRRWY
ncbi:alpha-amylase family glycosyl hydrolase [candidate division CSSED10-310 bacterium]|uniref:Alpha-amylase n=1 Tax=candidate division CSSED10-310 bacterium TaxID=2855610 RepID=A0ABV6Z4K3_UNCC1